MLGKKAVHGAAKTFLMENPEICEKIEEQIREKFVLEAEKNGKTLEYDSVDDDDEEFDGSPIEDDMDEATGIELEEED